MPKRDKYEVAFSNYGYAFGVFFNQYRDLCEDIIEKRSVFTINKKILSFISAFNYAIVTEEKRQEFIERSYDILKVIEQDTPYKELTNRLNSLRADNRVNWEIEIEWYKKYYEYLLMNLEILGDLSRELSYTFMPHTGLQRKYLSYHTTDSFYENFTKFQSIVRTNIENVRVDNFIIALNSILVYYYAYKLFIDSTTEDQVTKMLSIVFNLIFCDEIKNALVMKNNGVLILDIDRTVYVYLTDTIRMINLSFSKYGIIPRVNKKVYVDTTLI